MKREVSCRIVQVIFEYAKEHSLPIETLLAGVPYTLDHLRNKHERIEWDVYGRMMSKLRPILSDDDFEQMGLGITKTVPFRNLMSVTGQDGCHCESPVLEDYRWRGNLEHSYEFGH